jgi:hypothetical protein
MHKQPKNADKNEFEDDLPMEPLVPQAPKGKQDAIKKKPYSNEQLDEQKQRAEADRVGEQSVRTGLV